MGIYTPDMTFFDEYKERTEKFNIKHLTTMDWKQILSGLYNRQSHSFIYKRRLDKKRAELEYAYYKGAIDAIEFVIFMIYRECDKND